ncbi:hypothetical protein [Gimesia maris]|uniref:EF-hand domain-containing protein n=1 Tax=Gimesia maris TaxID=122 RepID=A0ABX5YFL8_9PLAN|nr:hypothetical protein [Gimesia maris]EDL59076.1 hypothetical protein PM8797T_07629 [Gimesia maris DSM 8797]QDT76900.1 hypothetical protein Mal35_03240 [Gimesia maris]QDU12540.1 hypothetical protein CA11_03190 [Gimesia maris]QEG14480.1 hypothetical protein GmarT_03150 [Gimesia maris]QGQ32095.1 hypothetical protein F1729_27575 [Gimesia maris]|tara:strand:+ start:24383 stop:25573 length:1191 start_codon:yes stop_codon:yes gene_type:complete
MTGLTKYFNNRVFLALICGLIVFAQTPVLTACPFCSAPSLTLTEQLSQSDVAVLAQWKEAEKGTLEKAGKTVFEVKEIVRQADKDKLKVGDQITINRHRPGKKGNLFLLLGTKGTEVDWGDPIEVTETSFHYISQAPAPEEKTSKRLKYFLKFLEYPDQMISNDAYAEFANAPYEDITPLSKEMPREKIRKWLLDPDTPVTRIGLYGLLLGLCGTGEDVSFMEKKINEPTKEFRLGIDGVISGYLLLTGSDGLDKIDETKFVPKDVAFSETYAAMQALRFMWTYGDGRIDKERLRKSMRLLLDRPELTDLVVADLARWDDWSVLDRLMDMYGTGDYDIPSIKRAIVRYLLVASKGKNKKGGGPDAATTEKAKKLLDKLRKEDPKTVQSAERFFFLK